MNCSPVPWAIIIKNTIIAHAIPKTSGETFLESSFTEEFRIAQWVKKKIVITVNILIIVKLSNIFAPSPWINNMDLLIFHAVSNSLAL